MSTDLGFSLQFWNHSIIALAFCLKVKEEVGGGGVEKNMIAQRMWEECVQGDGVGGRQHPTPTHEHKNAHAVFIDPV